MSRIGIACIFPLCAVVGLAVAFLTSDRPEPAPARDEKSDAPVPPQGRAPAPVDTAPAPRPVPDTHVSKTTGMKFVRIQAGTFTMGSAKSERSARGETAHEVTLTKDFYLGAYEVTHGEFRKFVEGTGYETDAEANEGGRGWVARRKQTEQRQEFTWRNTGFEQTDDHPVVNVTQNDAMKFVEWLSRKDGRTYRLPTEAEWEYACRGGSTTQYFFGDDEDDLAKYGNAADASYRRATGEERAGIKPDDGFAFTAPVGRLLPNPFGLYDMHGNVWEMCSDWYAPYRDGRVTDPQGLDPGSVRVGLDGPRRVWFLGLPYVIESNNSERVSRGGGWVDRANACRSAARGKGAPNFRSPAFGFRLAMEPTPPRVPPADSVDPPPKPKPAIDAHVSKATGMKFVRIKAGTFMMGSPEEDRSRGEDEEPHEVTLTKDYYMGVYEVTRGEFHKFAADTGYKTRAERGGGRGWDAGKKTSGFGREFTWQRPGFEQTDDHPVVLVSWEDAMEFAEWLSKKDGRTYRLPTEAEWEYACRGRSITRFHFGDAREDLAAYANRADVSFDRATGSDRGCKEDDGFAFTSPVGKFRPNKFGLYDMHGNVSEWCGDLYGPYPRKRATDPRGPEAGEHVVFRGGSWSSDGGDCRSATRGWLFLGASCTQGFRLVMEPPAR